MMKLSSTAITEATGQSNHDQVVEIEMIFHNFTEIDCLYECPNLRSFTMISGKLSKISNLQCAAQNLERLCLCDQEISKMENLCLPNLKELFLQQNSISKIQGLEGCPKIQKLWLFSNKIEKIENLHHCPDLREIWLHDNQICHIEGLSSLTHLQFVGLANNKIEAFKQIEHLKTIESLRDLSLHDEHYGTNPIVRNDGYRDFVLCHLKQLICLDGVNINSSDQSKAEDAYMAEVLKFSDRIDAVQREHEQEIAAINARKNRNNSQGDMLRKELLDSFNALESIITTGQKEIEVEHIRQNEVREKNIKALEAALEETQAGYIKHIDNQIKKEEEKLRQEDEMLAKMESRLLAEQSQALLVTSVHNAGIDGLACQHLADHSPDWRYVVSHFLRVENDLQKDTNQVPELKVLQIFKIFNQKLYERLDKIPSKNQEDKSLDDVFQSNMDHTMRLFYIEDSENLACIMRSGVDDNSSLIYLFTNPHLASFLFSTRKKQNVKDTEKDESNRYTYQILLCRVQLRNPFLVEKYAPSSWDELVSYGHQVSSETPIVQVKCKDNTGIDNSIYIARKTHVQKLIPQYNILCAVEDLGKLEERLEEMYQNIIQPKFLLRSLSTTDDLSKSNDKTEYSDPLVIVNEFKEKIEKHISDYQQRIWKDMDPETALRSQSLEKEEKRLKSTIETLRHQIDQEKNEQEQLLRSYRQQIGVSNRPRKQ